MLTATRNDPYLRDHPQATQQLKPAGERGTYEYPQGYGQPAAKGIGYAKEKQLNSNGQIHPGGISP